MILTKKGTDIIEMNEDNFNDPELVKRNESFKNKIHIIKLNIKPDYELASEIFGIYTKTKRFIISDNNYNISTWNNIFKKWSNKHNDWKKFYIENQDEYPIIAFLKRHNKVYLNLNNVTHVAFFNIEQELKEVLNIIEIMECNKELYESNQDLFNNWNGNLILTD